MYQGPFHIPNKTDAQLKDLVVKTQPLVRRRDHLGDYLSMIRLPDLRGCAFPWDPKFIESPINLVEVTRTTTLHRYGYHGFFKPSIAEVLCQMPAGLDADFFEVIGPETAEDLNNELDALKAGFHVATTIFYKRK